MNIWIKKLESDLKQNRYNLKKVGLYHGQIKKGVDILIRYISEVERSSSEFEDDFQISIPSDETLIVTVPDPFATYKVVNYGFAGVFLVNINNDQLNSWKLKIPNGNYEIIGEVQHNEGNFALRKVKQ